MKGVIQVLDNSSYGEENEIGSGDPFSKLEKTLSPVSDKEEPAEGTQASLSEEGKQQYNEPKGRTGASGNEDALAQVMADYIKDAHGIEVPVDTKDTELDILRKFKDQIVGDPVKLAEDYAKKLGYSEDDLRTARMINSGHMTFPERELYNKLSMYENFVYDVDEDMSDGAREKKISDAKEIITHMWKGQMSGATLDRNIKNLDEYNDDFESLLKEGIEYAKNLKQGITENVLKLADDEEAEDRGIKEGVIEVIKSGKLTGGKVDEQTVKQQLDILYAPTEKITYKDGSFDMVSKYDKELLALRNNHERATRIMLAIANGGDFKEAKEEGKRQFGEEYKQRLQGIFKDPQDNKIRRINPKTFNMDKVIQVLEERNY